MWMNVHGGAACVGLVVACFILVKAPRWQPKLCAKAGQFKALCRLVSLMRTIRWFKPAAAQSLPLGQESFKQGCFAENVAGLS
jgi:hypothetical protein